MKRIIKTIIVSISIILLMSCSKEREIISSPIEEEFLMENEYDIRVHDFALALNRAISSNSDFRKLIKSEVLKQFDGDYDLLLSHSMELEVNPSKEMFTKSSCSGPISVKDLLSYYFINSYNPTKSSSQSLDDLIVDYPDLQISIPENAEEWNTEEYIPNIAIVPSDYEEFVTPDVPGIDSEGNEIRIDAINQPSVPVIVVGQNERISKDSINGNLTIVKPLNKGARISLDLIYTGTSVKVSANVIQGNATVSSITLYRISENSNTFSMIGTIPLNTMSYNDYNIEENCEYTYYAVVKGTYVTAYGGTVQYSNDSSSISIITDNNIPNPVSGLSVRNEYATMNLLTWENPDNEAYKTQIIRTTPEHANEIIAVLDPHISYYYDEDVIPGEKWTYFVHKLNENNGALSSSRKTYIYNPYRNPSGESNVVIKRIHIDRDETEGWLFGRPEVYVTAYGQAKDVNGNIVIDTLEIADIEFSSKKKFEANPKNAGLEYDENDSGYINSVIANWSFFDDSEYYPILNINMREYDKASFSASVNADVKCGYKKEDDIDIQVCGKFSYTYANKNKDCGTVLLRYYENPEKNLTFTNYDSYITISEQDDNN